MCTLDKATLVLSKTLFNHKFTSKLESRGQSATLDKHWPSILSQLSVSVDPGADRSGGGSQSPWGKGGMHREFSQTKQYAYTESYILHQSSTIKASANYSILLLFESLKGVMDLLHNGCWTLMEACM